MLSPCPLSHSCGKMFNAVLNYTINQSSGSRELYCKHSLYVYCICSFNTVSLFCVLLTSLIFSLSQHHISSFICINIICANQMWYLFLIVWISHTESAAPVRPILFMIYRIFILLSSSYSCDHLFNIQLCPLPKKSFTSWNKSLSIVLAHCQSVQIKMANSFGVSHVNSM